MMGEYEQTPSTCPECGYTTFGVWKRPSAKKYESNYRQCISCGYLQPFDYNRQCVRTTDEQTAEERNLRALQVARRAMRDYQNRKVDDPAAAEIALVGILGALIGILSGVQLP